MPPMDALGGVVPQEPQMMDSDMGVEQNDSEFDTGFDAGVEADPDEDPKKYIQQLTGKLSQELRKYNNEVSDEELNKYVAGMIIPQAAQGLTDKGKKEIIGKIKKGNVEEPITDNSDEENSEVDTNNEMPMESKNNHKTIMSEIFQDILKLDKEDRNEKEITNRELPKRNPFVSNR